MTNFLSFSCAPSCCSGLSRSGNAGRMFRIIPDLMIQSCSHTSLRFVFDEEAKNSSQLEKVLSQLHLIVDGKASAGISYNRPVPFYKTGYDRQQWLKFHADNFSTAEYIGFVDAVSF